MKKRRGGRLLLEMALLLLLFTGVRWYQQQGLVDGVAPVFAGEGVNGETIDLAALRGEPVLVYFWASWCGVCNAMDGSVSALAEDHHVLSVAMQSGSAAEVRGHLRAEGLDLPVLNDPDGALARRYNVRGVPTAFIVGPDGEVAFTEVGFTSGPGLRARLWLSDKL